MKGKTMTSIADTASEISGRAIDIKMARTNENFLEIAKKNGFDNVEDFHLWLALESLQEANGFKKREPLLGNLGLVTAEDVRTIVREELAAEAARTRDAQLEH